MNLTMPQAPERSSPVILSEAKDLVAAVLLAGKQCYLAVILSEAKDLVAGRDRPFAALRGTAPISPNFYPQHEQCYNHI